MKMWLKLCVLGVLQTNQIFADEESIGSPTEVERIEDEQDYDVQYQYNSVLKTYEDKLKAEQDARGKLARMAFKLQKEENISKRALIDMSAYNVQCKICGPHGTGFDHEGFLVSKMDYKSVDREERSDAKCPHITYGTFEHICIFPNSTILLVKNQKGYKYTVRDIAKYVGNKTDKEIAVRLSDDKVVVVNYNEWAKDVGVFYHKKLKKLIVPGTKVALDNEDDRPVGSIKNIFVDKSRKVILTVSVKDRLYFVKPSDISLVRIHS